MRRFKAPLFLLAFLSFLPFPAHSKENEAVIGLAAPLTGDQAYIGLGVLQGKPWFPKDDFFGTRRGPLPTVGAIERPSGPIPLGIKP